MKNAKNSQIRKKNYYSGGFRQRRNNLVRRLIKRGHSHRGIVDNNRANSSVPAHVVESVETPDVNIECEENGPLANANNRYSFRESVHGDEKEDQNENDFDYEAFHHELVQWSLRCKVHEQLRGLLKIWNDMVPLKKLPADPRTLLGTPRNKETMEGNYWHYGVKNALRDTLENVSDVPGNISIRLNLDGIPLSKSSSVDCWPILVDIWELKRVPPCVIGVYCGKSNK